MTEGWLTLLQFADGLFPAGGFAHSLRARDLRAGRRRDRPGRARGVRDGAPRGLGGAGGRGRRRCGRPAGGRGRRRRVGRARRATGRDEGRARAARGEPADGAADAARGGGARRRLVSRPPSSGRPSTASTPGHHPAAFGAALGRAGVEPELAAGAYLYTTAALLVGAGLRLIALGQLDGQRVLAAMRPRIARLAAAAARRSADEMWSFNPGLELAAIRHATLDARLFRS